MVLQWIGVVLTVLGLALNSYKEIKNEPLGQSLLGFNNNNKTEQTTTQNTVQYVTIVVAYDHASGIHYFQHLDGKWYNYPPKP